MDYGSPLTRAELARLRVRRPWRRRLRDLWFGIPLQSKALLVAFLFLAGVWGVVLGIQAVAPEPVGTVIRLAWEGVLLWFLVTWLMQGRRYRRARKRAQALRRFDQHIYWSPASKAHRPKGWISAR